jgi:hypothetical protein
MPQTRVLRDELAKQVTRVFIRGGETRFYPADDLHETADVIDADTGIVIYETTAEDGIHRAFARAERWAKSRKLTVLPDDIQ